MYLNEAIYFSIYCFSSPTYSVLKIRNSNRVKKDVKKVRDRKKAIQIRSAPILSHKYAWPSNNPTKNAKFVD